MINLLADTLNALHAYGKNPYLDVIGYVYYNIEEQQWVKHTWAQFERGAQHIHYDPYDVEFIGMRVMQPTQYVLGDTWHLQRSGPQHNFEGWIYIDEPIDFSHIPFQGDSVDLDLRFIINDLQHLHSDYGNDENYERAQYFGEYAAKAYSGDMRPIVVGCDGRVYSSNRHTLHQNPALMWYPDVVGMVLSDNYRDSTLFNNETLSKSIGVDDARYHDNGKGGLTVTYIPWQHFTVAMDSNHNEQVHLTRDNSY